MIVTNKDFETSISSTVREPKGYVEVSLSKSVDKNVISLSYDSLDHVAIEEINGTRIPAKEVFNNDRKGNNYATLERNFFRLDGSFLLPNKDLAKDVGIGLMSKTTFNDGKLEFQNNGFGFTLTGQGDPTIISTKFITIYFKNNPPQKMRVELDDGTVLEPSEEYSGKLVQSIILDKTYNIHSFTVYIDDVLYTDRRVTIQEIDFALTGLYEDEELISFRTIEQVNRFSDEMPTNECEVVIGDYTGKFDNLNPNSIAKYLTKDAVIKPYVGVVTKQNGTEYISMGKYWLENYKVDNEQVTFTCKDIFSKLNGENYWTEDAGQRTNVFIDYDAYLPKKMEQWGLKLTNKVTDISDYTITNFKDGSKVVLPPNAMQPDTKLENLQKYCITFGNVITGDREGNLKYISSRKHGTDFPKVSKDILKDYQAIEDKNEVKEINVTEYNYTSNRDGSGESKLYNIFNQDFNLNGETIIKIPLKSWGWPHVYITPNNVEILHSNLIVDPPRPDDSRVKGFASQVYMVIRHTGTINIRIEDFTEETGFYLSEYVNNRKVNNTGTQIDIKSNLTTGVFWSNYYKKLSEISNAIIDYRVRNMDYKKTSFEFNGNPAFECGDIIEVEDKYPNKDGSIKYDDVYITKIESNFNGSFNQTIEGDILEK